ncbi:MAG TPA: hypothetical protein DCM71_15765, partial [Runella sp.]|nr:hypothetical protein [Runella sp.]
MNHPYYEYFALFQSYRYDFTSIGKNVIRKTVLFEQLDEENLFNLVLGDINSNGKVDVFAISDNG